MKKPICILTILVIYIMNINVISAADVSALTYLVGGGEEEVTLSSFTYSGIDSVSYTDVDNMPFKKAVLIETAQENSFDYQRSFQFLLTETVNAGESVQLKFYARSIINDNASLSYAVKYLPEYKDWFGYGGFLELSKEWQEINVFATVYNTAVPKDSNTYAFLDFNFGFGEQHVEIGGIELINYGAIDSETMDMLSNRLYYEGMEDNASWRAEAQKMIEENRMNNVTLEVVDGNNNAVPNADISLKMTRHAYPFGTAIAAKDIIDRENNAKTRELIFSFLNTITFQNDLKWPAYKGDWGKDLGKEPVMEAVDDLITRDIDVVGHVLYWGSWKHFPAFTKQYENNPEEIDRLINEHFEDILTAFKGKIKSWDVVNEAYDNYEITALFDDDYKNAPVSLKNRFITAKGIDNDLRLAYNDYGIVGTNSPKHYEYMRNLCEWFVKNNTPVDVIGIQSYFTLNTMKSPVEIWEYMDDFYGKTGLPMKFSEYNFKTGGRTDDSIKKFQYNYTRDIMTAVFAYPHSEGFIAWTNTGESHNNEYAGYFYDDYTLTPIGQAAYDLITKEWVTNEQGTADENGVYNVLAFHGNYSATVTYKGVSEEFEIVIDKDTDNIVLKISNINEFPVFIVLGAAILIIALTILIIFKLKKRQ